MRLNGVCHGTASATLMRVIIFYDTQQVSDTVPAVTDILDSDIMGPISRVTIGRFKILLDKTFCLDNISNKQFVFNKFFNIQHHVRFNGTLGTDVQKGGIYMLTISDEGANTPTLVSNIQTAFYDN